MISELIKTRIKLALGKGVEKSYSQYGEDAVMLNVFRNQKRGVYVDVGAYHPVQYSNTYAFYKRGWEGIVVDPNYRLRDLYKALRPRDTFLGRGIGEEYGSFTYYEYKDGAYNTFDEKHVEMLREKNGVEPVRKTLVPIRRLEMVVRDEGLDRIDILNIDAEGMDLAVLRSHDWVIRPRVICVEDHGYDAKMPMAAGVFPYLVEKGYELRGKAGLSLIFIDKKAV